MHIIAYVGSGPGRLANRIMVRRQTSTFDIKDKVFTTKDMIRLAGAIYSEYESFEETPSWTHNSFNISVNCSDGTSYLVEDNSIFGEDDVLALKRVKSLTIGTYGEGREKDISLSLAHSTEALGSLNRLSVSGLDPYWVSGVFTRLEEIIASAKPQSMLLRKYVWLWFLLLFLSFVACIWALDDSGLVGTNTLSAIISTVGTAYLLLGGFLILKLFFLWPSVELAFGPEHTRIEEVRRNRMSAGATYVVLPLSLSLIFEIGKSIFTR